MKKIYSSPSLFGGMLKADTSVQDSLKGKRQRCAWSFDYAMNVIKHWALGS